MTKFSVGEEVTVRVENSQGNPRTPKYIRGRKGVIVEAYGVIQNSIEHEQVYPPLYKVRFDIDDLFGTKSGDKLYVDIHEEWLEPT